MAKGVLIKFSALIASVIAVSYLFKASYYYALIIVVALGLLAALVYSDENAVSKLEEPDAKRINPLKIIVLDALIIISLIAVGEMMPELYNYGFYSYS